MKILTTLCMMFLSTACGGEEPNLAALHKAAKAGVVAAQERLAAYYFIGDGVAFDQAKAFCWHGQAAAQGSPYGLYNLGHAYEFGTGIAPDIHRAAYYYERAARRNHAYAQSALARLHASGALGERDYLQSHVWQILSQRHGPIFAVVDYRAALHLMAPIGGAAPPRHWRYRLRCRAKIV